MKSPKLLGILLAMGMTVNAAASPIAPLLKENNFRLSVHATNIIDSGKCSSTITWSLDADYTLTLSGTGEMLNYADYASVPWHNYNYQIKKIVVSEGITTIGSNAFVFSTNLSDLSLPSGITYIGKDAFRQTGLVRITLPKSLEKIDQFAFSHSKISDVSFNTNLKTIESSAFRATNVQDIVLPASVESVGDSAFSTCNKLERVSIYNPSCKIASSRSFCNGELEATTGWYGEGYYFGTIYGYAHSTAQTWATQSGYKFISFNGSVVPEQPIDPSPDTPVDPVEPVEYIDSETFGTEGDNLTWKLDSEGTLSIGGIGDMDSSIPWRDYRNTIKKVILQDGVESIGDFAFGYCNSLTEIIIPESVTSIGNDAFEEYTSLTDIKVDSDNSQYCDIDGVLYSKDKTILIKYPAGKMTGHYTIPDSVTSIGESAFADCTSLTSITIPDSVTSIGESAFYGCTSLTNITIPDSVTSIGERAFCYCTGLTGITIPSSVTSIDTGAFYYCFSLTSITIPDSVTSIGSYAFFGYNNLFIHEFYIPPTVTEIDERALCYNITDDGYPFPGRGSIIRGYEGTEAQRYAEENDIMFISLGTDTANPYIPNCEYVTSGKCGNKLNWNYQNGVLTISGIGKMDNFICPAPWWQLCDRINSIIIDEGVTSIGDYAFTNIKHLQTIQFADTIEEIGKAAFYGTTINPRTEIILPEKLKMIKEKSFNFFDLDYYYDDYIEYTFSNAIKFIAEDAFNATYRVIIRGYENSEAEAYAIDNDIKFISRGIYYNGIPLSADSYQDLPTYLDYDGEITVLIKLEPDREGKSINYTNLNPFYKTFSMGFYLADVNVSQYEINDGSLFYPRKAEAYTDNVVFNFGYIDDYDTSDPNYYPNFNKAIYTTSTVHFIIVPVGDTNDESSEAPLGDVTGDGEVSAGDAQFVLQEYVNILSGNPTTFTKEQFTAADVNKDGEISVDDAQFILLYYVNTLTNTPVTWEELIQN